MNSLSTPSSLSGFIIKTSLYAVLGTSIITGISGCDLVQATNSKETKLPDLIHEGGAVSVPETSPLRKTLLVAAVESLPFERPISAPGVVEADPTKLVKITPPLAGRIIKINKMLGDTVKTGDTLFTLDSAELSGAQSEAAKAHSQLQLAYKSLQRQQVLAAAEIIAHKDLEQSESDYEQAKSEAERTTAHLTQLGAKPGNSSQRTYDLRSPIAGRVIEMNGSQGAFWNDINESILTVADLSTVWMSASVSEQDIASVFVGQKATIILNAYTGQSFEGVVRYVGEVLDPDTRSIKVRVAIDNKDTKFLPGMFAKVVFSGQKHKALVVPPSALVQSGLYTRVFVEKAPFTYEPRVIKTGATLGSHIEVVSGLTAGERIVVKEGVLLND
ncbi:efflux RND transporter periplasmic adaptor subunit [Solimicrobium silvestre]|uniref:Efflux transporter, RND family, MFP subunit n=1 Tax=Solimicrobium silvestre TaxID=2099400 RepID=A0A2S9H524_9BURK|nr:efflux RND transporter periplasmic adaptor subunit [Solimicrobium silvestre]PRC95084.1 Efflux transporter, RND family, MFP subunit [Solimicrobium silvestre]